MMGIDGVNISKAQWNGGGARLYRGGARLDEVSASLNDGDRWS